VKKLIIMVAVAFAVTLAVVAGVRLSGEAMAVVLGMACGVVAGIPTSLLIAVVTNRRSVDAERVRATRDYPPVVVVQPGQTVHGYAPAPYAMPALNAGGGRQFHVVGEEATERSGEWNVLH
jgi:hypothetical protein